MKNCREPGRSIKNWWSVIGNHLTFANIVKGVKPNTINSLIHDDENDKYHKIPDRGDFKRIVR